MRNTWSLSPEINAAFTSDAGDWHANEAETDLMMFMVPETVRREALESAADPDRTGDCFFHWMVAQTSTNGVTGLPGIGNPTLGETLLMRIGMILASHVAHARTETPPLLWVRSTPVFGWSQDP